MKVYISADMEGVMGVIHPEDVIPGRPQYERFRKFLTADVNAAIEGAIDRYTARCLHPKAALSRIRGEAADAIRGVESLAPYTPSPPYTFTVEFATASTAAGVVFFPQLERIDDRRVSWTHEDFETAFGMFVGVMKISDSDPDYG